MVESIAKFIKHNPGRDLNDLNNKMREDVITHLWSPPQAYLDSLDYGGQWREVSNKFKKIMGMLCSIPFDDMVIKKKAGRKFNYDFDFVFMNLGNIVHKVCIEFKHNATSICDLPQYLNLTENIGFMPYHSYAEYFYDEKIEELCELADLEVPNKDQYMKYVYQNNYDKFPFFRQLKDKEASIKHAKSVLVNDSIREYLEKHSSMLNLNMLSYEIKRTQTKVFLLWDGIDFHLDEFTPDDMAVGTEVTVKNGNTIVVNSGGGYHNLLLRWKNHKGILFPAWQIKLTR